MASSQKYPWTPPCIADPSIPDMGLLHTIVKQRKKPYFTTTVPLRLFSALSFLVFNFQALFICRRLYVCLFLAPTQIKLQILNRINKFAWKSKVCNQVEMWYNLKLCWLVSIFPPPPLAAAGEDLGIKAFGRLTRKARAGAGSHPPSDCAATKWNQSCCRYFNNKKS